MPKPPKEEQFSKETGVKYIKDSLKKGVAKSAIIEYVSTHSKKELSTIYRWFYDAEQAHEAEQERINKMAEGRMINKRVAALEKAKQEQEERLTVLHERFIETAKIRKGKLITIDKDGNKEITKITVSDELKANQVLCQLDERICKAQGLEVIKTRSVDANDNDSNVLAPFVKALELGLIKLR